ncbi:Spo0E family sporulation regulatory protein-aspartic acid phosphatase [Gracilibacillus sp. HCP3S3_G5_1]|uniref:Spo0E family sporulation regulatory protein-aspartic acid phosphatase n=1 Tax=unclassified Gracilibacillus TaxID=2625209 RepID=UPI003F8C4649
MGNSEANIDSLLERIEVMRDELVAIGLRDGLTAPTTLEYSKLLDEYIKIYQRVMKDRRIKRKW